MPEPQSYKDRYNSLPYATDSWGNKTSNEGALKTILDDLKSKQEFSNYPEYGVWVAHRHFSLKDGEMMVTRKIGTDPDRWTMAAETGCKEMRVTTSESEGTQWTMAEEKEFQEDGKVNIVVADRWRCDSNNNPLAYEFIVPDGMPAPVQPPDKLCQQFCETLADAKVSDKPADYDLGICWLALSGRSLKDQEIYFETTPKDGVNKHEYEIINKADDRKDITSDETIFQTSFRFSGDSTDVPTECQHTGTI